VFATIVWANDGSEAAADELGWVTRFAAGQQAMLWVVHVAPSGAGPEAAPGDAEETAIARLKDQVRELRRHGCAASLYVIRGARGPLATAIDAAARAVEADLLVVGAGSPPGGDSLVTSALAVQVLAAASYPVLSLPAVVSPSRPAPAAARF
jgi:nucleotide-binding universal stress UspA family protein